MTSAASSSSRIPWLSATLLYVVLTLAYAWPLLPVIGSALPNDTGDPGLNTWILWWNAHAIPLTSRWWNGPLFYPAQGAMALSETFLNLVPLSTPLQWAGVSAVLTYNILFLLSFPAAALSAHALAHRLTGRHDAALLAGLAFGFAPYRAAQMPHLQTLWSCWMPIGLLFLHRVTASPGPPRAVARGGPEAPLRSGGSLAHARSRITRRHRDLWLFGFCWMMNGLATGYFLFYFSVLVGLWLLWFARTGRDWIAIAATMLVASVPLAPLLMGYQHYQSAFGVSRSMQEIEFFSADLSAIWATTPYVWPHFWTLEPRPEGELYPGGIMLGLAIAGAIAAWRAVTPHRTYRAQPLLFMVAALLAGVTFIASRAGGWAWRFAGMSISLTRPVKAVFLTLCLFAVATFWNPRIVLAWRRRSPLLFYAVASALMLLFALGPVGHVFKSAFLFQAPYYWLMQLPGGHAFRVPARFAMLLSLCLSIAAAIAFARLVPRGRTALAGIFCLGVAAEGFVARMEVAQVPVALDLAGVDRGSVLLDVPIVDDYSDTAAMLRATQTGQTLVNGFSGYLPPHYELLKEGLANRDPSIIAALQRYGPLLVFNHQDADRDQRHRAFLEEMPDAHRVLTTASGSLYRFPARPLEHRESLPALSIASIVANTGEGRTSEMTDNDLTTRWQTSFPQTKGNAVVLTFDRPVAVSRVELDLGQFNNDYPRKLRVSVADSGAEPKVVWEGRTTGTAMIAALTDRRRMPLVFDLAPPTPGRQLILTLVDGHPDLPWSIAELNVFGK